MIRDDETGVTPLRGQRPGEAWEAKPPRGYSWPPFQDGNAAARVHGARSEREIGPRAVEIMTALLEDPAQPDHVRSPVFRHHVWAWARAESVAGLLFDYLAGLSFDEMVTPRLAATRSPVDLWKVADGHAGRLRSSLGLDPAGYAKIRRDLGLSQRASEEALEQLSAAGAAIVAKRRELGAGQG